MQALQQVGKHVVDRWQRALEQRMTLAGEDLLVVSFMLSEQPGVEPYHRSAVHTKGVDTLLPGTDLVDLSTLDTRATVSLPWPVCVHRAGYLL